MHLRGSIRNDMACGGQTSGTLYYAATKEPVFCGECQLLQMDHRPGDHANMATICLLLAVIGALASLSGPALHAQQTALEVP